MRQDVYGVAYAEANAELSVISKRFEQLRARKEHLEGVVRAISGMLGVEAQSGTQAAASRQTVEMPAHPPARGSAPANTEPAAYTFNQVPVPLPDVAETGGDPFQRRVRNALRMQGMGSSPRDLQQAV